MDDFQSHLFERLPEQDLDSKETELVHLVHRALREAGDGLLQRVVFAEGRPGEVYLQGFHASVLLDEVAADFARDGYDVVLLSDEMARRGGTRGHQVNGERGGGRRRGRIGLLGAAGEALAIA